jgi:hypothetical protein
VPYPVDRFPIVAARARSLGWLAAALAMGLGCTGPNPAYRLRGTTDGPANGGVPDGPATRDAEALPDAPPDDAPLPDGAIPTDAPADTSSMYPMGTLIGHWQLNEASGATAADVSPYLNHGDLEGFVDPDDAWQTGRLGNALLFDPTRLDAGVRIDLSPSLRGLTQFTIAAWTYRTDDTGLHGSVASQQLTDTTHLESFNLTFDGPDLILYMYPERPDDTIEARFTITGGFDRWVHVAATFDGAVIRLFVDGTQRLTLNYTGRPVPSDEPIYLGTNKNSSTNHQVFNGLLDDVRLYADAQPAATIESLATP